MTAVVSSCIGSVLAQKPAVLKSSDPESADVFVKLGRLSIFQNGVDERKVSAVTSANSSISKKTILPM